jgi:hypothetical protein
MSLVYYNFNVYVMSSPIAPIAAESLQGRFRFVRRPHAFHDIQPMSIVNRSCDSLLSSRPVGSPTVRPGPRLPYERLCIDGQDYEIREIDADNIYIRAVDASSAPCLDPMVPRAGLPIPASKFIIKAQDLSVIPSPYVSTAPRINQELELIPPPQIGRGSLPRRRGIAFYRVIGVRHYCSPHVPLAAFMEIYVEEIERPRAMPKPAAAPTIGPVYEDVRPMVALYAPLPGQ